MNKPEIRIDGVPQTSPSDAREVKTDEQAAPTESEQEKTLEEKVIDELHQVFDPEIPVNIYELGLVYDIEIDEQRNVAIKMTLTSPACPVAESLPVEVRGRINRVPEVTECDVEIVWDPPWGPDRMSEVAKLKLGML